MELSTQIAYLFLLAIPIACIAWTITHEEITREPREYCLKKSKNSKSILKCKFFYLFTCEYCFSHYVTIFFLLLTQFKLLYPDWRGYIISGFSLVWVANIYMSAFQLLRVDMKKEKMEADIEEIKLKEIKENK
ncbi:MAG: hypothetical protein KA954_09470 [Chitinophagales bacterium]|nr:hypothetical protein [Bacteroidota bacterium]MBP7399802.1 hypothetical protein [Chitinophagales bacterium]MBK8682992.1 hypothetical protein [Bacteroidota bacterium]MBP8754303.1 hypothetical protein [Chitinophagales bacterium]MBP9189079.1 hypothetical protein [Chitinophagales bacterium]